MALILRQIGGVISLVLPNSSLAAASGTACAAALQERRQSHATATSGPGAGPLEAARAANAPLADPWTFTSQLIKRKTYQKRCRHLIQVLEREQVERLTAGKELPAFRSGDILEVTTVVPEAGRKAYTYRGVCLARANKGPRSWLKLYNVFPDVGGFVQHLPIYMPDLLSVKVLGRIPRARRSRLYHLLKDESTRYSYQAVVEAPR